MGDIVFQWVTVSLERRAQCYGRVNCVNMWKMWLCFFIHRFVRKGCVEKNPERPESPTIEFSWHFPQLLLVHNDNVDTMMMIVMMAMVMTMMMTMVMTMMMTMMM